MPDIVPPSGFTLDAPPSAEQPAISPPQGFVLDRPHPESAAPRQIGREAAPSGAMAPPSDLAPIVATAASRYGVPLQVANWVGSHESGWNPDAIGPETSHGRAAGAWQFMPETAAHFKINPHDFGQSTNAAMQYLRQLADKNGGDWERAVADYGTFSTGKGPAADASVRQSFRSYMGQETPVGQDVAQGFGRGLMTGAGSVLGMPADVWHMIDRGYQLALTEGARRLGIITPETAETLRAPIEGEESSFGSEAINRHLLNISKSLGANTDQPLSVPGQYAETVGSFLPAAGALGAETASQVPRALLKYGAIPGATSETMGQLTQGTSAEPYARVAGAVAPAAASTALATLERIANPTGRALAGVTEPQFSQAQQILDQSRQAGAPLTSAEAIQSATGSGTRLGDVQRVVEQSPRGGAIMRPFFAQRPEQTQALGQTTFGQIAPAVGEPAEVAPRVQAAAEGTVNAADRARTSTVKPFYDAAKTDTVPVADMDAFLGKIDNAIAEDKTGLVSPQLVRLRNALTETPATNDSLRLPVTDINNLDTARKYFRDQIALPAVAQEAIPKQVGARMGSFLDELDNMMEQASPNFLAGKQRYQDITRSTIEPLLRSPTGQLAAAEEYPKQAAILFNPNPLPGSEAATARAIRDVASRDPEAAQQLVRLHLERTFNEATQANLPGANQFGGPKFAAIVAGNSQQAKNLEAAVRALPDGATRWAALKKSMDIMRAMGTRQPVGSQTEFNRQINEFLRIGHPAGEVMSTVASPARWTRAAYDMYHNFMYGRNTEQLARIFTQGDVSDLRKIVQSRGGSLRSQAAFVGALARQGALTPASTQPSQLPAAQQ